MSIAHDSSVDIGNHRYTNEQNCILLKKKYDKKKCARLRRAKFFLPPQSQNRSYGLACSCCDTPDTGVTITQNPSVGLVLVSGR